MSSWFKKGKNPDPNYIPELDIGIGGRPSIQDDYAFAVPFPTTMPPHGITRVAVLAHIFYPDLCSELLGYINHIPVQADLYISTDTEEKREIIKKTLVDYAKGTMEIRIFPNRGRDIAPKIVGYADVYRRYDYFLHIHTKKTLIDNNLSGWRTYLYQNLLGSPEIVTSILTLLQREEMGVVFPQHYDLIWPAVNWGHCFRRSRDLLEQAGIPLCQSTPLEFPSGSMFWGKSKALRLLLDRKLEFSDFDEESGQIDGTLAHVVEHSFLYFVEAVGYIWAKVATKTTYPHRSTLLPVTEEKDIVSNLKRVYHPLLDTFDPDTGSRRP